MEIKQINEAQINDFINFLRQIAVWLNETGKGMWSLDKLSPENFLENNKYTDCFLGYLKTVPVASIILKEQDSFMWPDKGDDSIYINKLGVARNYSGKGYAQEMLQFAYSEAQNRSKQFIRLDCYADREYLCQLYEDFGFKLVEKREMQPDIFAALYELEILQIDR